MQAMVLYARDAEYPPEKGHEAPPPSQHDVKRVFDWLINEACGAYDEPFVAGQPDVKDYLLGRRSIGLAIVKLMKIKPELIEESK